MSMDNKFIGHSIKKPLKLKYANISVILESSNFDATNIKFFYNDSLCKYRFLAFAVWLHYNVIN